MTLPYPSSPVITENIEDSISRIYQNLSYLDGNIGSFAVKQITSVSVEMSTSYGSTRTVAGVGFTPTAVIVFANEETGNSSSFGVATSSTLEGCNYINYNDSVGIDTSLLLYLQQASGASQEAVLQSFHSDGAYFDWTKTGSPTGSVMNINYIFIR